MKNFVLIALLACAAVPALAEPDADVAQRQQIFRDMQSALASLDTTARGGDVDSKRDTLKENAQHLALLSGEPWALFGRDTTIARRPSSAGAMIWSDPAGFRAAAAKLTDTAQTLNATAGKISADDLKKSAAAITAACEACHQTYLQR